MEEIRKNYEDEKEIVRGRCKLSFYVVLVNAIPLLFIGLFVVCFNCFGYFFDVFPLFFIAIIPEIIFIVYLVFYIAFLINIKRCYIVVTDKRIYGLSMASNKIRRHFSYRLDHIDNVELRKTFGYEQILVNINQGYFTSAGVYYNSGVSLLRGRNTFLFNYLTNGQEVYEKLNELLLSVRPLTDVVANIETQKLDISRQQVKAIESLGKNQNNVVVATPVNKGDLVYNYIDELRELKELLEQNIISQEDFDKRKQEILDREAEKNNKK